MSLDTLIGLEEGCRKYKAIASITARCLDAPFQVTEDRTASLIPRFENAIELNTYDKQQGNFNQRSRNSRT